MDTKNEYKDCSGIIIWNVDQVELHNAADDGYYTALNNEITYFKIVGEFYYCGLLIDGILFFEEKELLGLVSFIDPDFDVIKCDQLCFLQFLKQNLDILRKAELEAKHFSTDFVEDEEEDDIMYFLNITKEIKSRKDNDMYLYGL